MRTWLILDMGNLAHRAFHAFRDVRQGTLFGIFRDIVSFQAEFGTKNLVFCFDHGTSLRVLKHPGYKETRRANFQALPAEEREARINMREQVSALRTEYLAELGFKNIFFAKGYEADDLISSIAREIEPSEQGILVSSDKDLYQCLAPNISIYNAHSKSVYTEDKFHEEWKIPQSLWPNVKAIAGEGPNGDNIPGVDGVGEITAAKYIRGELSEKTASYKKIRAAETLWRKNLELVKLPFPGTPEFDLQVDDVDARSWDTLADKLGMQSLVGALSWRGVGVKQRS